MKSLQADVARLTDHSQLALTQKELETFRKGHLEATTNLKETEGKLEAANKARDSANDEVAGLSKELDVAKAEGTLHELHDGILKP